MGLPLKNQRPFFGGFRLIVALSAAVMLVLSACGEDAVVASSQQKFALQTNCYNAGLWYGADGTCYSDAALTAVAPAPPAGTTEVSAAPGAVAPAVPAAPDSAAPQAPDEPDDPGDVISEPLVPSPPIPPTTGPTEPTDPVPPIEPTAPTVPTAPVPTTEPTGTDSPTAGPQPISLDPSLPASFSLALTRGYLDDPRGAALNAGGPADASSLGCGGSTTVAPMLSLAYTGRRPTGLLRFMFTSDPVADTELIVRAPDASYYCSDDSYGTPHPTVDFAQARGGTYQVWVSNHATAIAPGNLWITEQAHCALDIGGLDCNPLTCTIGNLTEYRDSYGVYEIPKGGFKVDGTEYVAVETADGLVGLLAGATETDVRWATRVGKHITNLSENGQPLLPWTCDLP